MRIVALVAAFSASLAAAEHPVARVLSLIKGLEVQVKTHRDTEAAAFQEFDHFCANGVKSVKANIASSKEVIEQAKDRISGLVAKIDQLGAEMHVLTEEIMARDDAQSTADEIRSAEQLAFSQNDSDLAATIQALQDAIDELKNAKPVLAQQAVKKAALLAESVMSASSRRAIKAFLQDPGQDLSNGATGRVRAYDFHSNSVVEILKQLLADFASKLVDARKAETNSLNQHSLAKQANLYARQEADNSLQVKTGFKGDREGEKVDSETARDSAQADLLGDKATLLSHGNNCTTKAREHEARQAMMAREIEAMEKAREILAKQTGVRDPERYDPRAHTTPSFFVQFAKSESDPKDRAVTLLRMVGEHTHSKAMAKLASAVSMYSGPFDKVVQMIQKLIFHLQAEQKDEDEHKHWCDVETGKTVDKLEEKNDQKSLTDDKYAEATTKKGLLEDEIRDANDIIAEEEQYLAEEAQIRWDNKTENAAAAKDFAAAQIAIAQATAVLSQHYKNSGEMVKEAWESFVQIGAHEPVTLPDEPSTWDAGYTGIADPQAPGAGVLAVLEELGSNFASLEATVKANEATDQKNYEVDVTDTKSFMRELQAESKHKGERVNRLSEKLHALAEKSKHLGNEVEAAEIYMRDLSPACHEGDSTYDERKAARSQELEALRQAQRIFEDAFKPKSFLQRK